MADEMAEDIVMDMNVKMAELHDEIQRLNSQLRLAEERAQASAVEALNSRIEARNTDANYRQRLLVAERRYQELNNRYQEFIQQAEANAESWHTDSHTVRAEWSELMGKYNNLMDELLPLREQRDLAIANANLAQESIRELENEVGGMILDMDTLSENLASAEERANAAEGRHAELHTQIQDLERQISAHVQRTTDVEDQLRQVREQLQEAETNRDSLTERLAQANSRIQGLQQGNNELEQQAGWVHEQLSQANSRIQELEKERNELNEEAGRLNEEARHLHERNGELTQQLSGLRDQNRALTQQLSEANALVQQLSGVRDQNSALTQQLSHHLYSRGYVGRIVDSASLMCGCIEDMPVVSRSDCTQVNAVFHLRLQRNGNHRMAVVTDAESDLDVLDVNFRSCIGVHPGTGERRANDLASYAYRLTKLEEKMTETQMEAIFDTLVGHNLVNRDRAANEEACRESFCNNAPNPGAFRPTFTCP